MSPSRILVVSVAAVLTAAATRAEEIPRDPAAVRERIPTTSYTDFGGTGLMQTPSGRMHEDGDMAIGASHVFPYYRYFITLQMLPWLEGSFRYNQIQERTWGDQDVKDKGVDVKVRLLKEGDYTPDFSVGLRDLAGTGKFQGEYAMISRRYRDFDFSLGLGWGNLGTRGQLPNPVGLLIPAAKSRTNSRQSSALGGNLHTNFFTGERVSILGGVEYSTPIDGLRLKVELDGNDYQSETEGLRLAARSPVNFGVEYEPVPAINLAAGFERGSEWMLRATLKTNFNQFRGLPKFADAVPAMAPRARKAAAPAAAPPPAPPADGLPPGASVSNPVGSDRLEVRLDAARGLPTVEEAARSAMAAGALAPEMPSEVRVVAVAGGGEAAEVRFDYGDLVRSRSLAGDPLALTPAASREWTRLAKDLPAAEPARTTAPAQPTPSADAPMPEAEVQAIADILFPQLAKAGLPAHDLKVSRLQATLRYANTRYRDQSQATGRAARLLGNALPDSVERLHLVVEEEGIAITRVSVLRRDIEQMANGRGSPAEVREHAEVVPDDGTAPPGTLVDNPDSYPAFGWGLSPQLRQHVGGMDNFYYFQVWGRAAASVRLAPGLKLYGSVGRDIYNNFGDFSAPSGSKLPHVRSDIRQYLEADTWVENLYGSYIAKLSPSLYARASVGIFEQMYGAVGGEVLYYQPGASWALALDVNRARQRAYDGGLEFLDYKVDTGHLTWYQKLPFYNLQTSVAVGRYLAGDKGVTGTISRTFDNGIRVGLFASKTNVSAEQFGEGSFDKGFTVSIPMDLFSAHPMRSYGYFAFRPLTRDGGQMLGIPDRLYPIVESADPSQFDRTWEKLGQ